MIKAILIFTLLLTTACSTTPHSEGWDRYKNTINNNSAGDKKFSGVYENFEFRATMWKPEVINAINDRKAEVYQWDEEKKQTELAKVNKKLNGKTKMFMSFYTPNLRDNNLEKVRSIWKVYLHTSGERYEGKVRKSDISLTELQALFPYHNRWANPYVVVFPVDSTQVSGTETKMVVTGPLGKREVKF